MKVDVNRGAIGKLMNDRRAMDKMLVASARPIAQRLEAATPRRTGETAASTRIETGHTNATRDRVAVRIVQGGASVPLNWRLHRNYMVRSI